MTQQIRIKLNAYGNYVCFIGRNRICDFGQEWDARAWAASLVKKGNYHISDKSDISAMRVALYVHNFL